MSTVDDIIAEPYLEYHPSSDRYYRVVYVGGGKYKRDWAPSDYEPTAEQVAMAAERRRSIHQNERWLSANVRPLTRQRRFRPLAWALGLRRARRA